MLALIKLKEFLNKTNNSFSNYKQMFCEMLAIALNKALNLAKTNFDLGIYHLNHGNITDAILRFNVVKKLFGGFPNVDYHLARCYIYNQNSKKALNHLALDEPLAIHRRHIIENREINYIPLDVIIEDFDFHANFEEHYSSPLPFINLILSHIIELKEVSEFARILDLGCGRGNFGIALETTFTHPFEIDALDISPNMINHCRALKDSNDNSIYNNFYLNDYRNFQIEENKKYDLVIANLSLHYSLNLADNLSAVAKLITNKGFILLTLYTSDATSSFDYEFQNFCYNEEFIKTCATKNSLNLVEIYHYTVNENKKLIYCLLKTN